MISARDLEMNSQIYDKMVEEYYTSLRIINERIEALKNAPAVANSERRLYVLYCERSELEEDIRSMRKYCSDQLEVK